LQVMNKPNTSARRKREVGSIVLPQGCLSLAPIKFFLLPYLTREVSICPGRGRILLFMMPACCCVGYLTEPTIKSSQALKNRQQGMEPASLFFESYHVR